MYKRIINGTFIPVFKNNQVLIKALFLPLLLIIILDKISRMYSNDNFVTFSIIVLSLLINITIAITTHRILLLGSNSISTWGFFKLGKREFSFLITSIFIGIIIGIVMTFGAMPLLFNIESITSISLLVTIFFSLILFSRFSLALPSIAIDKEISISQAWEYTKNYKLLTFFTIVIFPIVFALILGIVYELAIGFLIKIISPHLDILYPVLDVFITVFIVSALSATYRVIKEDNPEYFERLIS